MTEIAHMMTKDQTPVVTFGRDALRIEDILALAHRHAAAELDKTPAFRNRIDGGAQFLDRRLLAGAHIYGVTTGYGDSCTVDIPGDLLETLPHYLVRYHGCGMGKIFEPEAVRAVIAARLTSLSYGVSGVRYELLERLAWLLNEDVLPLIPEEGSVGASGDLTPLSYVAAALIGERDVLWRGRQVAVAQVYEDLGMLPLQLRPKEGLALMNGTAVMTGVACLAIARARQVARLSARLTSLSVLAIMGNPRHFDERLFAVKPHPGQMTAARWIREDLQLADDLGSDRIQDRYSLRCAPHVIGVLLDFLSFAEKTLEIELNSANDNPIIDADHEAILHGGHFYGGHVAMVMDTLKTSVANVADLMDRQLALLVDPKFNNGLPGNLTAASKDRVAINHGFKAVQIAVSSWTAEALKLTMPASVFSRSTECHNQDKVSMGTIAARDCIRILELTEQVAAAHLMALVQAVELRMRTGALTHDQIGQELSLLMADFRSHFDAVIEDRALEQDLRKATHMIRNGYWGTL